MIIPTCSFFFPFFSTKVDDRRQPRICQEFSILSPSHCYYHYLLTTISKYSTCSFFSPVSQERLIELEPPGGLRTLDEGRSVRTFPQFMLDPFANELFDTLVLLSFELDGIFERESRKQITLIFSNSSFDNSPSFSFLLVFQLRLMELLPPGACKTREDVLPSFTK